MSGHPGARFPVGPRDAGKRLDRFLAERIPLSRSTIRRAVIERVRLSWPGVARPATRLRAGGEVLVAFTPLVERPRADPIAVLARGRGWLAVDKPAGMPVHPTRDVRANSLIWMMRRIERTPGLRLAHRLDRETSGVLLLATDGPAASALSGAFRSGRVHKEYLAVVRGCPADRQGRSDRPIAPHPTSPIRCKLVAEPEGFERHPESRTASTRWEVLHDDGRNALLRVFPGTGRRHQIRVHLAAAGHPVLGDLLYGGADGDYLDLVQHGRDVRCERGLPPRQLLHCARLAFPDPQGGGAVTVTAPVPSVLLAAVGIAPATFVP